MREILFRGKCVDNGEWVEGNLFIPDKVTRTDVPTEILVGTNIVRISYKVAPATVGQYTGHTDKNGVKIFEGDIVSYKRYNALGYTTYRIGDVRYYDRLPIFYVMATTGDAWDWVDCEEITVIGNIHDNPELLKGGDGEEEMK